MISQALDDEDRIQAPRLREQPLYDSIVAEFKRNPEAATAYVCKKTGGGRDLVSRIKRQMGLSPIIEKRNQVIKELKRDPTQTTAAIIAATGASHESVSRIRAQLGMPTLSRDQKRDLRIERTRQLIAEGYNVGQIAAKMKRSAGRVLIDINRWGLPKPRGLGERPPPTLDAARVIEQTVDSLSGLAYGLDKIEGVPVNITPVVAAELLEETKKALQSVRRMTTTLQEISNGNANARN